VNTPVKLYHEPRKVSPEKARMLVRKILEENNGNVSKPARILGISRHTVKRARDEMEKFHRKAYQESVRIHPKHPRQRGLLVAQLEVSQSPFLTSTIDCIHNFPVFQLSFKY